MSLERPYVISLNPNRIEIQLWAELRLQAVWTEAIGCRSRLNRLYIIIHSVFVIAVPVVFTVVLAQLVNLAAQISIKGYYRKTCLGQGETVTYKMVVRYKSIWKLLHTFVAGARVLCIHRDETRRALSYHCYHCIKIICRRFWFVTNCSISV